MANGSNGGSNGNGDDSYDFSDWNKADMQDALEQVSDLLSGVYIPESDRDDYVQAVSSALDILSGEGGSADDDEGQP